MKKSSIWFEEFFHMIIMVYSLTLTGQLATIPEKLTAWG